MDFLVLYLLIGLARLCAHLLECQGCKDTMQGLFKFYAESFIMVMIWPVSALTYLMQLSKKSPKEADDKELKTELVRITREEGESPEEFQNRIHETLMSALEKARKDIDNG